MHSTLMDLAQLLRSRVIEVKLFNKCETYSYYYHGSRYGNCLNNFQEFTIILLKFEMAI